MGQDPAGDITSILARVRQEPGGEAVVDHLLGPVLRRLQLLAPDPAQVVAGLARWAKQFPATVLQAAAYQVLEERHSKVREENIVDAIRAVLRDVGAAQPADRPAAPAVAADGLIQITQRQHPRAFAGWLAHYEAEARDGRATEDGRSVTHIVSTARKFGALRVPALCPPSYARPAGPADANL